MLSFDQIKQLIDIVCERDLGGLEVEETGFRLKIDGPVARGAVPTHALTTAGAHLAAPPPVAVVPGGAPIGGVPAPQSTARADGGSHIINSPIVGTFYSAPSPDAEAYVEVGSKVVKGQVLCIVEAMKLLNEIESDVDGEIKEIIPKNAQPVEYGEPLFAIKPD
ncbi:MAG: acetyl-CoA carboxylase biotin carboxyl carrier protein [Acidobacteriota bacterium]|nr:acetyl-CoA carboxylase biotin carboxyl carrier protein [Acidobacteriota bacterium]